MTSAARDRAPARPIRAAVLTVSDRCSRGVAQDTSGPALVEMLRTRLAADVVCTRCLPDERDQLAACFVEWSGAGHAIDLILSTGGTGLAPRDVTPEAARSVLEREHPGLMELARLRCMEKTPRTFLSRGVAGTIGRTLIITLPGSPRGCTENLEALLDILPHAIETLRGEVKDDGRPQLPESDSPDGRVIRHARMTPLPWSNSPRSSRLFSSAASAVASGATSSVSPGARDAQPLVQRPIDALRSVFGARVKLVGACDPGLIPLADGVLPDVHPDVGPMGGITSALQAWNGPVLVLAGDMPGANADLVRSILAAATGWPQVDAVIAFHDRPHPCAGLYRHAALAWLSKCLATHQYSLTRAIGAAEVEYVPCPASWLANVNLPGDAHGT